MGTKVKLSVREGRDSWLAHHFLCACQGLVITAKELRALQGFRRSIGPLGLGTLADTVALKSWIVNRVFREW